MSCPLPDERERSDRVLNGKLQLLYRSTVAILTNAAIGCVVVYLLRDTFPSTVLGGWLAAVLAVCTGRLLLQHKFHRAPEKRRCTPCAAKHFAIGAFIAGLLWGALCLGLPLWGDHNDFIVMAVVAAGMTAGALATISIYFPAYFLYTGAFGIPLTAVSLFNSDRDIAGMGAMMIVYFAAVSVTAKHTNSFVNNTVKLKVDNEILADSLLQTEKERDQARVEKWSTMAQLSHELRTPLNAVIGFSDLMQREFLGPLGNNYKEYAGDIYASGKHLLKLTEELLEMSRGESGELELHEDTVDPAGVIQELVRLMAPEAEKTGLSLATEFATPLPNLHADHTKLRQMLFNLLENAIKFTPEGGHVWVSAAPASNGGVMLKVRDDGIGMSQEDIPTALGPFGRLATALHHTAEGAGLGLPIAKRLAELHGASLTIVSASKQGTTCTIQFPAARSVPVELDRPAVAA
jgi:two-component system, cell cycle sensor histidine kinase PleC